MMGERSGAAFDMPAPRRRMMRSAVALAAVAMLAVGVLPASAQDMSDEETALRAQILQIPGVGNSPTDADWQAWNDYVYITGVASWGFVTTPGAFQTACPTCSYTKDAFVAKFDIRRVGAASLIYSTYLGGSTVPLLGTANDEGLSIAVDSTGEAVVTGSASSSGGIASRSARIAGQSNSICGCCSSIDRIASSSSAGRPISTSGAVRYQ